MDRHVSYGKCKFDFGGGRILRNRGGEDRELRARFGCSYMSCRRKQQLDDHSERYRGDNQPGDVGRCHDNFDWNQQ
jgi:hypothetical protein